MSFNLQDQEDLDLYLIHKNAEDAALALWDYSQILRDRIKYDSPPVDNDLDYLNEKFYEILGIYISD